MLAGALIVLRAGFLRRQVAQGCRTTAESEAGGSSAAGPEAPPAAGPVSWGACYRCGFFSEADPPGLLRIVSERRFCARMNEGVLSSMRRSFHPFAVLDHVSTVE